MTRVLALALTLALAGCGGNSAYKGLVATGESLKGIGAQFEAVGKVYKAGCDAKTIKAADCDAFRKFGLRFKEVYPITVDLWNASRQAGDSTLEKATRDRIIELSTELTRLAVVAYATFGRGGS